MRIAEGTGHVAWWVFVVAALMRESASAMFGMPRRYADYLSFSSDDAGWAAYVPLTDRSGWWPDPFDAANTLTTIALVAFVITVAAAVVQAARAHAWPAGIGTILAPVIGAAVIVFALESGPGLPGRIHLPILVVFVLVLSGIAIREFGSRRLAPARTR